MKSKKCFSRCRKVPEDVCKDKIRLCQFTKGTRKYCRISKLYKMDKNCNMVKKIKGKSRIHMEKKNKRGTTHGHRESKENSDRELRRTVSQMYSYILNKKKSRRPACTCPVMHAMRKKNKNLQFCTLTRWVC